MSTWTIDIWISRHDAVKIGTLVETVSRVHLSREDFPNPVDAEVAAAQLALSMHDGMATRVAHCL